MRTTLSRLVCCVAVLALAIPVHGADEESLPKGAIIQLRPKGLVFRFGGRVTLLPDGKTLLLPDTSNNIRRFDASTGQPLDKRGPANGQTIAQVVVSGDSKRAIVASTGPTIVRDAVTGEQLQELKLSGAFFPFFLSEGPSASFSFDGKVLARSGTTKVGKSEVIVWDVDNNTILFQTEPIQSGPVVPILSPDGKLLAIRAPQLGSFTQPGKPDTSRIVQVWDVGAKKELFQLKPTPSFAPGVAAVVFSPDSTLLAGSCGEGVVDVWDVKTGKPKFTLLGRTKQGMRLAFSPDGKVLAAMGQDGTVQRWSMTDEKPLGTTEGPEILPVGQGQGLVFVNNDRLLAWGMAGPSPVVWEVPSGKLLTPAPAHTASVKSIGFPAGGKELITSCVDGRVIRWDIATGKLLGGIRLRTNRSASLQPGHSLEITPDATWGLTLGVPSTMYDLTTGLEEFSFPVTLGGSGTIHTYLAADQAKAIQVLVPSDAKKPTTCTIWDLTKRQKLGVVEMQRVGHHMPMATLSPDGTRLVAATTKGNLGEAQTLVVTSWNIKTGKKLEEIEDVKASFPSHIVAVSNSTAIVATGSRLRAFDYEFGRGGDIIEPGHARGGGSWFIAMSADRKRLAFGVAGDDPNGFAVRIYDWPSGKALHTFTGLRTHVQAIAFSPDGKMLATSTEDTTVLLWDLTTLPEPK